jgi:hypothetical protein
MLTHSRAELGRGLETELKCRAGPSLAIRSFRQLCPSESLMVRPVVNPLARERCQVRAWVHDYDHELRRDTPKLVERTSSVGSLKQRMDVAFLLVPAYLL